MFDYCKIKKDICPFCGEMGGVKFCGYHGGKNTEQRIEKMKECPLENKKKKGKK